MPVPTQKITVAASRASLQDIAYDYVLNLVTDGHLVAGAKVDDQQISSALGISRGPVRQALSRLAEVGVLDMEPHRFTRVATASIERYLATVAVAVPLWQLGARLSLALDASAVATELETRIASARELADSWEEDRRFADRTLEVLAVFEHFSGNGVLSDVLKRLRPVLLMSTALGPGRFTFGAIDAWFDTLLVAVASDSAERTGVAIAEVLDLANDFAGQ